MCCIVTLGPIKEQAMGCTLVAAKRLEAKTCSKFKAQNGKYTL